MKTLQRQHLPQEALGGAEHRQGIVEHRNVAVYAPFVSHRRADGVERRGKVEEAHQAAVAAPLDDLVQVNAVIEPLQEPHGGRLDFRHLQRGRELQLEDRDAGVGKAGEACRGVLELDRRMADIEADPEVAMQCRFRLRS